VVIDAAAAFAEQRISHTPIMISLHATKILGAGEGAVVLSRNPDLIAEITRRLNFGFYRVRTASVPGFNGKMSEYSAAVGLASLDAWPETRSQWTRLLARYESALDQKNVPRRRPANAGLSSTLVYRFPADARQLSSQLTRSGIGSLRWYADGCHAEPGFRPHTSTHLPVTAELAASCLGLPFFLDLSEREIEEVGDELSRALSCANASEPTTSR
jgi:dTDP-4-amino-4,6-dideoxygalactose transaminase